MISFILGFVVGVISITIFTLLFGEADYDEDI
jgi:hypothetical protein